MTDLSERAAQLARELLSTLNLYAHIRLSHPPEYEKDVEKLSATLTSERELGVAAGLEKAAKDCEHRATFFHKQGGPYAAILEEAFHCEASVIRSLIPAEVLKEQAEREQAIRGAALAEAAELSKKWRKWSAIDQRVQDSAPGDGSLMHGTRIGCAEELDEIILAGGDWQERHDAELIQSEWELWFTTLERKRDACSDSRVKAVVDHDAELRSRLLSDLTHDKDVADALKERDKEIERRARLDALTKLRNDIPLGYPEIIGLADVHIAALAESQPAPAKEDSK